MAFVGVLDGTALEINQTANDGDGVIENSGGAWKATDDSGTVTFSEANTVTINLLPDTGNALQVSVASAHSGQLALALGNGSRQLTLSSVTNSIGGDLNITAGTGDQAIDFNGSVVGNTTIDLGDGNNQATFNGTGSGAFDFTGGSGTDLVEYNLGGTPSEIDAVFGDGTDTFHLMNNAEVSNIAVDFGSGADVFTNDLGSLDVPTALLGVGGFAHVYDPVTDTLTSTQRADSNLRVTFDNNGADNAFRVSVGTSTVLGNVSNLNVTMLNDGLDTLYFDFDNRADQATHALNGNLDVNLGNGSRVVNFIGDNNSIGGAFDLTGGTDAQDVRVGVGEPINVSGMTTIDLGAGADILSTGGDANFGSDVALRNVNTINMPKNDVIDGSLNIDNPDEVDSATLNAIESTITGMFTYTGGSSDDTVNLPDSTSVGGDINIRMGNGTNGTVINPVFGGTSIKYVGGESADNVRLGLSGNDASVNVKLGAGDDAFVLEADATIATDSLRIDFGGGDDRFASGYGQFDFNAKLLNLDGYNAFFDVASGNIDVIQVSDSGNVTIDNNGPASGIRFGNGTMNNVTPAIGVRLILMDNTSTNVTADFDSIRNGATTIQMRSGNRNVSLTGSSNTYIGLLRFEAADGIQNVHLAENADLNVTGSLVVNTRNGADTLTAGNAVKVSDAMLLRAVNNFVNDNGVDVGGDFNLVTTTEIEDTRLISNSTFDVDGNVTYLGGAGVDTIDFGSTGATIKGYLYANLETATDTESMQRVSLTGGFSASSVMIDGGTAEAGTFFATDAATTISGFVAVNLASSATSNTAVFMGTYHGTYGTYRGGTATDQITIGATAGDLLFAVLAGDGDDVLTVKNTTDLDFLYGDMGGGSDILDNQFPGAFPFANNVFNL